jgi:hypothetical protein
MIAEFLNFSLSLSPRPREILGGAILFYVMDLFKQINLISLEVVPERQGHQVRKSAFFR